MFKEKKKSFSNQLLKLIIKIYCEKKKKKKVNLTIYYQLFIKVADT